ncbi:MAG: hypothetical protein COA33_013980 [Fluviicola sp.]|nr:hypothetical protein [Fluviicola sp.]
MKHLFFCLLLVLIASCKREGCTDPKAVNYDYKVKIADNSKCIYKEYTADNNTVVIDFGQYSCSSFADFHFKKIPGATVDYRIKCFVRFGGKIIIDPGVTIEFTEDAGMRFDKVVSINGTIDSVINFIPVNSYWRGLEFFGYSFPDTVNVHYLNVKNAGNPQTTSDLSFKYWGITFITNGNYNITNIQVDNCINGGVLFHTTSFDNDVYSIIFDSVTISNCEVPLKINHYALANKFNSLSLGNNTSPEVILPLRSMGLDSNIFFSNYGVPFHLTTHESSNNSITLSSVDLNISAGCDFVMGQNAAITCNSSFNCIGNVTDSITFIGEQNTSNFWKGFILSFPSIDFVRQENVTNSNNSNMILGSGFITNSIIKNGSTNCGIWSTQPINVTGTQAIGVTTLICP